MSRPILDTSKHLPPCTGTPITQRHTLTRGMLWKGTMTLACLFHHWQRSKRFIRFLETDLKHSPIAQNSISGSQLGTCAKKAAMVIMARAESFIKLIRATCTDYVRLSIHPSIGGMKLAIPLTPQGSGVFLKTPWLFLLSAFALRLSTATMALALLCM